MAVGATVRFSSCIDSGWQRGVRGEEGSWMNDEDDLLQEIQITAMIPADGAQAVGGKLYILGGGFDRLVMPTQPFQYRFDLAMLIEVPWNATDAPYSLLVELLDADGEPAGYRAEAQFETARPPGIRQGTAVTVPVALPVFAEFAAPGRYILRGSINGEERRRVAIEAVAMATE
jgi:hypothetical protein